MEDVEPTPRGLDGEQPKASAGVASCHQPASAEQALVNCPGEVGKVGAFCACRRLESIRHWQPESLRLAASHCMCCSSLSCRAVFTWLRTRCAAWDAGDRGRSGASPA